MRCLRQIDVAENIYMLYGDDILRPNFLNTDENLDNLSDYNSCNSTTTRTKLKAKK